MRKLLLLLALSVLLALPSMAAITVIGQAHHVDSGASTTETTDTCSGSACSAGAINVPTHAGIYVLAVVHGVCYTALPTVTISDVGSANTFTQVGSGFSNSFWGEACMWHFWCKDAVAVTGDNFTMTMSASFGPIELNALVVTGADNAAGPTGHSEVDGGAIGGGSQASITTGTLGDGISGDLLIGGVGLRASGTPTIFAGACANSATCTMAAATQSNYAAIEYQILTGTQVAPTVNFTFDTSTGSGIVGVHVIAAAGGGGGGGGGGATAKHRILAMRGIPRWR